MNKKRLFVAVKIDLNNNNIKYLKKIKQKFSSEKFKWVEMKNIHLTLKFLGDTNTSIIPSLENAIEKSLNNFPAFNFKLKGFGVFKNISNPRVFWIGVENNTYLRDLYLKIEETVEIFGFKRETRDFNPHITLARIKSLKDKKELLRFILDNTDKELQLIEVKEIFLIESILKKEGPIYIEQKKFRLMDNSA